MPENMGAERADRAERNGENDRNGPEATAGYGGKNAMGPSSTSNANSARSSSPTNKGRQYDDGGNAGRKQNRGGSSGGGYGGNTDALGEGPERAYRGLNDPSSFGDMSHDQAMTYAMNKKKPQGLLDVGMTVVNAAVNPLSSVMSIGSFAADYARARGWSVESPSTRNDVGGGDATASVADAAAGASPAARTSAAAPVKGLLGPMEYKNVNGVMQWVPKA